MGFAWQVGMTAAVVIGAVLFGSLLSAAIALLGGFSQ